MPVIKRYDCDSKAVIGNRQVKYLLACLTNTIALHAMARQIRLFIFLKDSCKNISKANTALLNPIKKATVLYNRLLAVDEPQLLLLKTGVLESCKKRIFKNIIFYVNFIVVVVVNLVD